MIVSKSNYNEKFYIDINLSFFEGEKTEKPTQKKKNKAREEGQVSISREIATAITIISVFLGIKIFSKFIYDQFLKLSSINFDLIKSIDDIYNETYMKQLGISIILKIIIICLPVFLIALIVSIITNVVQVGWHPTFKPLQPKFDAFNPVNGLKKMFSFKQIVDLFTSILKVVFIAFAIYSVIKGKVKQIQTLMLMDIFKAMTYIGSLCIDIGTRVGYYFIIIAILDFIYQKFSHLKKLKMTKQELKEEYKQIDGDPIIKSKIKQKMRESSLRRMMQEIPNADVVITNPTHYAIAIKYDRNKETAPTVVAKGVDHLAKRIKEIANQNQIEIVENKPLARALYDTVDIGKEIPPELYQAVAEVLAFVYKLKNKV